MGTTTDWRERLRVVIFEADTAAGKAFDVVLILSILLSVAAVMLDSVRSVNDLYGSQLYVVEWFFTVLFSIEYGLRLATIGRPALYARSFFGIVDLLSILPTYLSLIVPGSQYLLAIRILRVLRVFRILKFVQYMRESRLLLEALAASRRKITVFLFAVLTLVVILGSIMYVVEGEEHGFTSIPRSIYWSVVTLTTVGYGDISPKTTFGQTLAMVIMIIGYGIIAVPTGIVSVELAEAVRRQGSKACPGCIHQEHDVDALHCKRCGSALTETGAGREAGG